MYNTIGKFKLAIEDFKTCLSFDAKDMICLRDIAFAYWAIDDFKMSKNYFDKVTILFLFFSSRFINYHYSIYRY